MSQSGPNIKVVDPYPVRCVDNTETTFPLTKGRGYMVTGTTELGALVQVRGDDGLVHLYGAARFVPVPLCKKCGDVIGLFFNEGLNRKLMKLQFCHSCEFWATFAHDMKKEPHRHFVAEGNGYSYHAQGTRDILGMRGFGGAQFYIRLADGRLLATNNLSHRGDIPLAWKTDLPDNAVFLSEEDYLADQSAQEHGAD